MSGRIYDICSFYVCDDCGSFDCYNAVERNYNSPMCKDCKSINLLPNDVFNNHVFKNLDKLVKHIGCNPYVLEGTWVTLDREKNMKIIQKKKKILLKKYGRNRKEYERNKKLGDLLD